MIITRTPTRIPLGGGGTDLPSYYSRFGGFFVSAAIDKYNYITVKPRFENGFRVSYSKTEITEDVDSIQQPIVREALKLVGVTKYVELTSVADVPGRSGLGGSSSYTVGVLNALHVFNRDHVNHQQLADEACLIEINHLKEPIGKQDQYVAAFGGIAAYEISKDGKVHRDVLKLSEHTEAELESNILLFYTGVVRDASAILEKIMKDEEKGEKEVLDTMHKIKEIGYKIKDALTAGDLMRFGELLDLHWQTKKKLSSDISSSRFDDLYDLAKRNGAIGGKIMGAGGGGFFMFYSESKKRILRELLSEQGMREVRFRFDHEGSQAFLNI